MPPPAPAMTQVSLRTQMPGVNTWLQPRPFPHSPPDTQPGVQTAGFHISPQPLSVVDPEIHTLRGPALDPGTRGHAAQASCTAGRQLLDSRRAGGI